MSGRKGVPYNKKHPPFRMMTTGDIKKALALYETGMSLEAVADELGFTRCTIKNNIQHLTRIRSKHEQVALRLKLPDEKEAELIRLYQTDTTMSELKRLFDRSDSYITHLMMRKGIPLRGRFRAQHIRRRTEIETARKLLVLEMYEGLGMSTKEIGDVLGHDYRYVIRRLRDRMRTKAEFTKVAADRKRESAAQREERDRRVRELISNFRREFQTAP